GVTLYELLTLQAPFAADVPARLVERIVGEDPPPPRQWNPAIPRDLETVVLKAMARSPSERYATAQELADDLGRYLRDEPVRAPRPTPLQRLHKWARRHRLLVGAAAACLLVAGAVLAGSVGWVLRDRAARQAETERKVRAALHEATALQGQKR